MDGQMNNMSMINKKKKKLQTKESQKDKRCWSIVLG